MAYPVDPNLTFYRDPSRYPHDAFGVDTGGRKIPHTGIDFTAKDPKNPGPAKSVYGGKVVETGIDKEAGRYYIIAEHDGGFWVGNHLSSLTVKAGDEVKAGQVLGILGNTGNSSGVHLHLSRATTLAAAQRLIHGYINYKSGRTILKWAESMGLTDPMPFIQKSSASEVEGFLMALTDAEQKELLKNTRDIANALKVPNQPYNWFPAINNKLDDAIKAVNAAAAVSQEARDALLKPVGGFPPINVLTSHVVAILKVVKEQASAAGVAIDEQKLADGVLDALGKAIVDRAPQA